MKLSLRSFIHFHKLLNGEQADELRVEPLRIEKLNSTLDVLWERHGRFLVPAIFVLLLLPIWVSIGDHGFNGRSDARYAVVSMDMTRTGEWLVPHYMGRVHLTKPPLVYWLEAASISLFGHTFFAVRFPSALSGTFSLLLLFWFGKRVAGIRVGLFAAAIYAAMPLTILPTRMTVTDSIVNLFWMLLVFSGFLSVEHPKQRRWGIVFWVAASLGMLAKGPVLFIPIGLVGAWRLLKSNKALNNERRFSHGVKSVGFFALGLVFSAIPVLLWAYAVYVQNPQAVDIWLHETLARAAGSGDHTRPIWFFIPIFFAGCFPASAMLLLPGINLRWKEAIVNLRNGSLCGFLGWAVIAPFVVYSLISGKLASYILPICAPVALISAMMLEQWFSSKGQPKPGVGRRIPEVRWGILIGTALYAIGIGSVIWMYYGPERLIWLYGLLIALGAAVVLVWKWNDHRWRVLIMAMFLSSWILGWTALEEFEDIALEKMSFIETAKQTFGEQGWQGQIGVFQLEDGVIYWDVGGDLEHFETPEALASRLQSLEHESMLILTNASQWDELEESNASLYQSCEIVNQWYQWPGSPKRYLVVCRAIPSSN